MKERSFRQKCIITLLLALLFLLGKRIPLPWALGTPVQADEDIPFARLAFGTGQGADSLFALGLSPYISASILMMFFASVRKKRKERTSPETIRKATIVLALVIAAVQAIQIEARTSYRTYPALPLPVLRAATILFLLAGSGMMILLMEYAKKHGAGGAQVLIGINILRGLSGTVTAALAPSAGSSLLVPVLWGLVSLATILLTVLLESSELRIPVQRISLHNDFAGDDYIAIRLHPAGTMPAMYAMSLFSLLTVVLRFFQSADAADGVFPVLYAHASLKTIPGVLLFLLLLVFLTFLLGRLTVDPEEVSAHLRDNGDYIEGVRPGKDTERFLTRSLSFAMTISSCSMCLAAGVPLVLRVLLRTENALFSTSITLMMLTGLVTRIMDEFRTEKMTERYRAFL